MSNQPFITAAEVSAYSNGQAVGNTVLTMMERACDVVTTAIRNDLRDPYFVLVNAWETTQPSERTVYGSYSPRLILPVYQVGSITAMVDQLGTSLNLSSFTVDGTGALVFGGVSWASTTALWSGAYRITAKWGCLAPPAIREIATEITVNLWRSAQRGQFTDQMGIGGKGEFSILGRIDSLQASVIHNFVEQYRREARYE